MKRSFLAVILVLVAHVAAAQDNPLVLRNIGRLEAMQNVARHHGITLQFESPFPDGIISEGDLTGVSGEEAIIKLADSSHQVTREGDKVYRVSPRNNVSRTPSRTATRRDSETRPSGPSTDRRTDPRMSGQPAGAPGINRAPCGGVVGIVGCTEIYGDGVSVQHDRWGTRVYRSNPGPIYSTPGYAPGYGGVPGAYYGGYYYEHPVDYARKWRKFGIEEEYGAFRISGGVSEKRLRNMDVYVDGCYRDVASELNNFLNGKVGLTEGHHRIEVVDKATGEGLGEDVYVETKAVTETFRTQHFNIRVDLARLKPGYTKMACDAATPTTTATRQND